MLWKLKNQVDDFLTSKEFVVRFFEKTGDHSNI